MQKIQNSIHDPYLIRFVTESNAIEGIRREPLETELEAHRKLWSQPKIEVLDLALFVSEIQPGAILRNRFGLDVIVGNHVPPSGGPEIDIRLKMLLARIHSEEIEPHIIHCAYETLHPFTDGNGRSGRALWAWQMIHEGWDYNIGIDRGFLHQFYYQTLQTYR